MAWHSDSRSLVMDLFGDYLRYIDHGEIRLGALLDLLGDFGIESASARVTLSRLRRAGWFTTRRDGRETLYQLSGEMLSVLDEGRERIFTRVDGHWDGQWTQVLYQVPESARRVRESLRKKLTWMGFGQFASSVWLSPHAVVEEAERLRHEFPQAAIDVLRSQASGLTADAELVERCWDLGQLDKDHQNFIDSYAPLADPANVLEGGEALVARTSLVADARRMTFRDPRLPLELQPAYWKGDEAFDVLMRAHARLGPPARTRVERLTGRTMGEDFSEHY